MTTIVNISAHCNYADTEVQVDITDSTLSVDDNTYVLQNGESAQYLVYGGRTIFIREVPKDVS